MYALILIAVLILLAGAALFVWGSQSESKNETPATSNKSSIKQPKTDEELARALTPCELLTDSERAHYGLEKGEADDTNIRGCDWDRSDTLYTHVSIYPLYGLEKFERDDATTRPFTIGSHRAQLVEPRPNSAVYGSCEAVIAIGPNRSASVVITANGKFSDTPDPAKYCGIAKQLAIYMEARLP